MASPTKEKNSPKAAPPAESAEALAANALVSAMGPRPDLGESMLNLQSVVARLSQIEVGTINVLRGFANPSPRVAKVMEAVGLLKGHEPKTWTWSKAKHMLTDPGAFKLSLMAFDEDSVNCFTVEKLEPYVNDPELALDKIEEVSSAAAVIMSWVHAIDTYFRAKHGTII